MEYETKKKQRKVEGEEDMEAYKKIRKNMCMVL
jgi:hypothetical protein